MITIQNLLFRCVFMGRQFLSQSHTATWSTSWGRGWSRTCWQNWRPARSRSRPGWGMYTVQPADRLLMIKSICRVLCPRPSSKLMDARAGRRGDEYTVYQGGRRMWRGPSRNPSGKYLSVNTQPLASGFGGDRSIIVITATSAPAATENQAYVPLRDSPESKSRTRQSSLSVCLSVCLQLRTPTHSTRSKIEFDVLKYRRQQLCLDGQQSGEAHRAQPRNQTFSLSHTRSRCSCMNERPATSRLFFKKTPSGLGNAVMTYLGREWHIQERTDHYHGGATERRFWNVRFNSGLEERTTFWKTCIKGVVGLTFFGLVGA